jgi:hypothetical protein
MGSRYTLLKAILAVEALIFVAGLPAWDHLAGGSAATQAYLLFLGVFSALAVATLHAGKPAGRIWAWAAAVTNLPVFPGLTPVGLLLAGLLLALDLRPRTRPAWPPIGGLLVGLARRIGVLLGGCIERSPVCSSDRFALRRLRCFCLEVCGWPCQSWCSCIRPDIGSRAATSNL